MNDQNGFPKYQFSVFVKNGMDAQYVVRSDNKEDFEMMVEWVKSKVTHVTPTTTPPTTPQTEVAKAFTQPAPGMPDTIPVSLKECPKCLAKMVVNPKTGNVFCSNKCWLKV